MTDPIAPPRRVAIACQGGGSHTAFTAGVLKGLLAATTPQSHRIVGLSGTSGGAVCALLAWRGLIDGDRDLAIRLLERFWAENSATAPHERTMNAWMLWAASVQHMAPIPEVSPYDTPVSMLASDTFRRMLEGLVDFRALPDPRPDAEPALVVGAVDVLSGEFRAFDSRTERIDVDAILASAAIPNLFRSVHTGGGVYWDGLFSQNPPVRELVVRNPPDELWVIQINAKVRDTEPTTVMDIADRRNELAGNLSLHQELGFIEVVDRMLEEGVLSPKAGYRPIVVRIIEMERPPGTRRLGVASKLNRDPAFIRQLIRHGEDRARDFLTALSMEAAWRAGDADDFTALFTDDAEFTVAPPFPAGTTGRGRELVRAYVAEHLNGGLVIDLTRKQLAGASIRWAMKVSTGGAPTPGVVEARLRDGRVVALSLGQG